MHIAILGGSFDPVHHGHLIAAQTVGEELGCDQVRLIPAALQPFKVGQHHAAPADRLAMVQLAVKGSDRLVGDDREIRRGGTSYTVDTLREIRSQFPSAQISLLLGSDTAALFPKWREPDQIRAIARVVVFLRNGDFPIPGLADRTVVVPRVDISSTAIRDRIRAGRTVRYWIPDGVVDYIKAHGLYRDCNAEDGC